MKYNFVYKTTNNLNGDYYYGVHSTNNLDDGYMGSGARINRSINKYGKENFTREIVQFFSSTKCAFSLERAIVTPELISDPHCLNISVGGKGGNTLIGLNENEYRKFCISISKSKINKKLSKEHCENIRKSRIGQPHPLSEQGKQSIITSNKNRIVTEETRKKKSRSMQGKNTGKKYPQLSEKLKGRIFSEEHIQKLRGKKSPEHCKHIGDVNRNTKYVNNGKINKRVKQNEIDIFLNNGWTLGRLKK